MKKLKKFKLENLSSERFDAMNSLEMNAIRGGQTSGASGGSGTSGSSGGSGGVCHGSGTEDDPYVLETVTCTPDGGSNDGCDC